VSNYADSFRRDIFETLPAYYQRADAIAYESKISGSLRDAIR
jgi:hypothetical protein